MPSRAQHQQLVGVEKVGCNGPEGRGVRWGGLGPERGVGGLLSLSSTSE